MLMPPAPLIIERFLPMLVWIKALHDAPLLARLLLTPLAH